MGMQYTMTYHQFLIWVRQRYNIICSAMAVKTGSPGVPVLSGKYQPKDIIESSAPYYETLHKRCHCWMMSSIFAEGSVLA